MSDDLAETIVVLTYRLLWFLGQWLIAVVLWNLFVAPAFGWPDLGVVESIFVFTFCRLFFHPPKLNIMRENQ